MMLSGVYTKEKYHNQAKEFGANVYLTKPFSLDTFIKNINDLLNLKKEMVSENDDGQSRLLSIIAMVENNNKTCTIKVISEGKEGCLFFNNGELMDAESDEKAGVEAVKYIFSWEDEVQVQIEETCVKTEKNIDLSCKEILEYAEKDQRIGIEKEEIKMGASEFKFNEENKETIRADYEKQLQETEKIALVKDTFMTELNEIVNKIPTEVENVIGAVAVAEDGGGLANSGIDDPEGIGAMAVFLGATGRQIGEFIGTGAPARGLIAMEDRKLLFINQNDYFLGILITAAASKAYTISAVKKLLAKR